MKKQRVIQSNVTESKPSEWLVRLRCRVLLPPKEGASQGYFEEWRILAPTGFDAIAKATSRSPAPIVMGATVEFVEEEKKVEES